MSATNSDGAFRDCLPYNVTLVELDEGPRLITNIVNPEAGMKAERPVDCASRTNMASPSRVLR